MAGFGSANLIVVVVQGTSSLLFLGTRQEESKVVSEQAVFFTFVNVSFLDTGFSIAASDQRGSYRRDWS